MSHPLTDRLSSLHRRILDAWGVLDMDARKEEVKALEIETSAPDFWSDQERARTESQKLSDLKKDVDAWDGIRKDVEDAVDLVKIADEEKDEATLAGMETNIVELEKRFSDREFDMLFSGAYDDRSAILSIHAGAGGTDAQDWAEMLLRMYVRYAEKKDGRQNLLMKSWNRRPESNPRPFK